MMLIDWTMMLFVRAGMLLNGALAAEEEQIVMEREAEAHALKSEKDEQHPADDMMCAFQITHNLASPFWRCKK